MFTAVKEAVEEWFWTQLEELFTDGIHQLVPQQTPVEVDDFCNCC